MRRLLLAAALLVTCAVAGSASAQGKPDTESAYADGQTVTITAARFITNPSPQHLANANYLYLAAYPVDATATGGSAVTFASGYQPNCDPCFHPGLPAAFVYHDHVLSGAPTLGDSSTPRHLIILLYRADSTTDPSFQPLKSVAAIKAGEASGMFQAIGSGSNPYEVDSGILVVTPSVSPNA
jgi:hypothetical protein